MARMRYGVAIDTADVPKVCAAGFDYVELRVTEAANPLTLDDRAFREKAGWLAAQPLRAECFCVFLPPDVPVVGPNADEERFRGYVEGALPRIKQLGAQVVVWGSGATRRIPEGFPKAEAWRQFKTRVAYAAGICERLDIRIALESLYRQQTNFLNTIGECLDLADELRRDVVGVVADIDHMAKEEPDLDAAMRRAGSRVIHVHLRDSNGRVPGYGGYDFGRFARLLKEIGYPGRASIEARMDLDAELADVRRRLEEL